MLDLRLELPTAADVPDLLDMMEEFNGLEQIPWSRAATEPALRRLMADAELGIAPLILEGPARCGYAVVTWGYDLEWAGRDAFLTELYLRPAQRGRGLGRAALGAIERAAVSHGARALHLMVREENHAAVRLYRGAGYVSPPRTFLTKVLSDDR